MSEDISRTCQIIARHFQSFLQAFEVMAMTAADRFRERDWDGQRTANVQRIALHKERVEKTYQDLILQDALPRDEAHVLTHMLDHFLSGYADKTNSILAYGFVDALLRKILYRNMDFAQVYTTREYSFGRSNSTELLDLAHQPISSILEKLFEHIFTGEDVLYQRGNAAFLENRIREAAAGSESVAMTVLPRLFYRNQHAYLLGKIQTQERELAFAIAFINPKEGIVADALLCGEKEIKRIFTFSRSYLLTQSSDPWGMIDFLLQLMPSKTEEQLIINLGYLDAGRHRMLQKLKFHLKKSHDRFDYAPGIPGMVMLVFSLPDYPLVFKLVRDHVRPPKSIRKEQVLSKYDFVARHDRAGRLADVQLYEYLVLPLNTFDDALLQDIRHSCQESMMERGDYIILKHVMIERKMRPLNLFLQEADQADKEAATLDYGRAIKEMAMINIFPGDMLIKNFGVTAELKVVFYDYDEVCRLQDCNFRKIPQARYEDELMSAEPWFSVGENDVFPEEFVSFLIPKGPLFKLFSNVHGDIFEADFWNYWKEYYQSGQTLDLQPYDHARYAEENTKKSSPIPPRS
jgi:isocitrate dehydrogenase kinase/phosphatase